MTLSISQTTTGDRWRRQRGSVLIFFVMLLFVFFGFAALVIDLGLVKTAQQRMSSAADSAALEGLRWRDQFPDSLSVADQSAYLAMNGSDPTKAHDQARRDSATLMVARIFGQNQPNNQFGAGPTFTQQAATNLGGNPLGAMDIIQPDNPPSYTPTLATNVGNADNGDMVAGNYVASASHLDGQVEAGTFVPYERLDLVLPSDPSTPSSAFLVRIRRSNETPTTGIASTGAPIPFLFGRGTMIQAQQDAPQTYSARRDGLTVRATSIAGASPVVRVGVPIPGVTMMGACPVAILRSFWEGLPAVDSSGLQTPVTLALNGNQLELPSQPGVPVGFLLDQNATAIGVDISSLTGGTTLPTTPLTGYFPIVQQIPATIGPYVVIGFGWASVTSSASGPIMTKLVPNGGGIAPRNASADPRPIWPSLVASGMSAEIMAANAALADPLLAPVLVRSIGN